MSEHQEQDLLTIVLKMQERLSMMEQKIDTLLVKSQQVQMAPRGPYSEGRGHEHGRHFEKRGGGENRGYQKRDREYGRSDRSERFEGPREGGFSKFRKHHHGGKPGFGGKKPFPYKNKHRR
ncbi:MAG: hypothetical protein PHS64_01775 [Candidatus Omnitrophica bacterium]|nr:hypothetical protein [Candidatus Omnitrophota bacterium]HNQ50412.1 hypothetical protein [Candidatus Omnitrophota bacterium]HQO37692.1 hypothetical protein [Candidatus Omnitrophota bacterium]HQQ05965.1 hypothetical protein [Candidatus Omnitrophota bacterium]